MDKELKRSIIKLSAFGFFTGMVFWYGVEQLFLQTFGDANFARGLVTAAFVLTMGVANIPFGALSDIWGRVNALRLGVVFELIGLVVLILSNNMWVYAFGGLLWGLYWSLVSGASEAFLYDKLLDAKKEKLFEKYLGRVTAMFWAGVAIANFASGFIAEEFGLRSVYVASFGPAIISLIIAFTLREPQHHKRTGVSVIEHLSEVPGSLKARPVLRWFLAAGVALSVAAVISEEFGQVAVTQLTDSPLLLGLSWTILSIGIGTATALSHRVRSINALLTLMLALMVVYIFASKHVLGLAAYMLAAFLGAAALNRNQADVQEKAPKNMRATIGSVSQTVSSLVLVPLSLIVGATVELNHALVLGGTIITFVALSGVSLVTADKK